MIGNASGIVELKMNRDEAEINILVFGRRVAGGIRLV